MLHAVLVDSINQIELEAPPTKFSIFKHWIKEKTRIESTDFLGYPVIIELTRDYFFKTNEVANAREYLKQSGYDSRLITTIEELEYSILDQLLFVFFYNLLRLCNDPYYFFKIYTGSELYSKSLGRVKPTFPPAPENIIKDLADVDRVTKSLITFVKNKDKVIIDYITKNKELKKLFVDRIMLATRCYQQPDTIAKINQLLPESILKNNNPFH